MHWCPLIRQVSLSLQATLNVSCHECIAFIQHILHTSTVIPYAKHSRHPGVYTSPTPPFHLANKTATDKKTDSDCAPTVHIPTVRGRTPAMPLTVGSSALQWYHVRRTFELFIIREVGTTFNDSSSSNSTPMLFIIFYSSEAYLHPSRCPCK